MSGKLSAAIADARGAETTASRVESPRLYVFDCGKIDQVTSTEFGFAEGEIASEMFTPCYLVAHPKGLLMWDTGEIPDDEVREGRSSMPSSFKASVPLADQLASVGYAPEQVDFLALSHYHNDHVANASLFSHCTWLVQRAEHEVMFADEPNFERNGPIEPNKALFARLEGAETIILDNEDHDVFGDGSVVIKFTPGHTPGHQSLFVRLEEVGPVLISGDLYHFYEEVGRPAAFVNHASNAQTTRSRVAIEAFVEQEGADLWIPHDIGRSRSLRIAPAYYQ